MFLRSILLVAAFVILFSSPVLAQQIVYPAKGQSAAQQQRDEGECYAWAKGKTGYDPVQTTQYAPVPSYGRGGGERVGGAARGALGGAAIGAIAGDAGKGAAIGAIGGLLMGGARKHRREERYNQAAVQQQQAIAQQKQYFQNAYAACFEGRGYTVR